MATLPAFLGKYRVTGALGEGAMGVVYKGYDPGIGREVALKTIRHALMDSADGAAHMLARFRNEAQAAGRLQHLGIVAVYDYGEEGDLSYIAMEYVDGNPLNRYLAGGELRFSLEDVLSLASQLLDALEHAHAKGVWHRDIKPANLLLTNDGKLKIADFGIARIESAALTQVTSVVGTPVYMAPEQFIGKQIDRRADLYAVGVLLYQLLVGRTPFQGSPEALMYRVLNEAPVMPSAIDGFGHGELFDAVLQRALAKDPQQRFASAWEFKLALQALHGKPVQPVLSDNTMVSVRARPASTPASPPSSATLPTDWDPAVLAQVEASLARHVGPMAAVMVRRTARQCADVATLYAKLAEQVTNPTARTAFLALIQTQSGGRTSVPSTLTAPPSQAGTLSGPLNEALLAQCTKLLAQHVGPIASVVVKRASASGATRESFFAALENAIADPVAREKLRAALHKL
ncbi:hypothetical protein IP87_10335 [beta proteobacterium AAP121]|nr:hypothetical protein IP80_04275 [beta proteobacterium AAP65]KPF97858.1 hypothetical protein IP87_10335 [beta proteobacterium AAP121]